MPNIRQTLCCLFILWTGLAGGATDGRRPNILMILVDDLGFGDLSIQGADDMRTPNIDRLFESGMSFRNFYSNCTVCSPARASLLTGKYPDRAGVPGVIRQDQRDTWGYLDTESRTIAELLGSAGYRTALIGKWHLGLELPNTPNGRGFQYFKGFLGDMMDDYWTHLRDGVNWMRWNEEAIDPEGHATDLFGKWAREFIEIQKDSAQPFFLYLAFNAPHDPIHPPAEWLNRVLERESGIAGARAGIVALIEHLDDSVGKVLDTLERTGQDDNTLVVFASDNGGALAFGANNGSLNGGKGDHLEGGIRVPMAVRWKDSIQAGTKCDNIAMLMDLYPTFCEVAGVDPAPDLDGISILPSFLGREQATDDRVLFWVRQEGNMQFGGQTYYAARYKNLKLVQNNPFEPYALYDLQTDPGEIHPLPREGEAYTFLFRELMEHIRITTSAK